MFPKRSPPQMTPSDRVRQLWADFELWHSAQHLAIEQRVSDALRELDLKWRDPSTKNRMSRKELNERKTRTRLEIEKTFSGNMVRLEWQKRLDRAGLQSDIWIDITEAERRKVETILGADLDPTELAMPVLQSQWPQTGTLFSPVLGSQVLESYAVVDPHSFSTEGGEETEFEPWMEVVKKSRSDDEISLDASTSSSLRFDGVESPTWSSGLSRSSTQTSQTSSPEQIPSKSLVPDVTQSLLSEAKFLSEHPSYAVPVNRPDFRRSHTDSYLDDSSSSSLSASSSFEPASMINEAKPSKSRIRYIGPELTNPTEVADEEAEFEKFKMDIRIQKIREFHEEAALADIQLMKDIAKARKLNSFTREQESRWVEEHEENMLKLRKRKEDERRRIVDGERQKRRAELHQPTTTVPASDALGHPETYPLVTRSVERKETDGVGDTQTVSETPTVRQHWIQRGALRMDWSSGGETPTPVARSAVWASQSTSQTQPIMPADVFNEAPPLKRLPVAPTSSHLQPSILTSSYSTTEVPSISALTQNSSSAFDVTDASRAEPSKLKEKEKAKVIQEPKAVASSSKTTLEKMPKGTLGGSSLASSIAKPSSSTSSAISISTSSGSNKPKIEPMVPSSSKSSASSSSSRPKVEQTPSSSSISSASTVAKARTVDPTPPSTLTAPTVSSAIKPKAADVAPSSTSAWPTSSVPNTSKTTTASSVVPTSTWTSWAPTASVSQPPQVPEDRRVWVPPPSAMTDNKRPPQSRKTTDPPQIEKSVSNPHKQVQPPPMPAEVRRRTSEPLTQNFDLPSNAVAGSSKVVGKQPERTERTDAIGILKKSAAANSTSGLKLAKGAQAKKVTVEDVDDEDVEAVDRLPADSRYIMEPVQPKPVVPPAIYSQIFEYDDEKEERVEMATPVQSGRVGSDMKSRSNDRSAPRTEGNAKLAVDAGSSKPTKHVRWSSEKVERTEAQKDSFLSMLDSLEAMVQNDNSKRDEVNEQADELNRLLSEPTEKPRRSDRDGYGGEASRRRGPSYGQKSAVPTTAR